MCLYIISKHWGSFLSHCINTQPTSSSLSSWVSDHYTSVNIKLLNRVVSLLGTGFYILLLIIVITMFHIFLVFKSCPCNVLASFDINFVSSLCILFQISLSHFYSSSTPPVLKLGQQKGWAAQHTC